MRHFPYARVAIATALLTTSLMLGWTSSAAAMTYIDRTAPSTQIVAKSAGTGGFDWIDAGIGGATVLGLGLVAAGACVLVLRHRRTAAFS
jgi:hypothetical protein